MAISSSHNPLGVNLNTTTTPVRMSLHTGPPGRGLTVAQVSAELGRHTYKPGYQLDADLGPSFYGLADVRVLVGWTAPDSYDPTRTIPLISVNPVPHWLRAGREFTDWLHHVIRNVEMHEADEWFRADGVLVHNPHSESQ